jgi:hypothetical protein
MSLVDYLLEQTAVYRLWQAPFAAAKLAPMLAHNDIGSVRRVLGATFWNTAYSRRKAKR